MWVGCMEGGSQSPRCTHPFPIQANEQAQGPWPKGVLQAALRVLCVHHRNIGKVSGYLKPLEFQLQLPGESLMGP